MNIEYGKILNIVKSGVANPSFQWQILAIIICLAFTFIAYKAAKKFFFKRIEDQHLDQSSNFYKIAHKYVAPSLLLSLVLIALSIGVAIFSRFHENIILFSTTIQLVALFLFLRLLSLFFDSKLIVNIVSTFLIPAFLLNMFDLLQPAAQYLDSYAIKMGTVRLSIYTVVKAFVILMIVFWLSGLISRKSKDIIQSNKAVKASTKIIISKMIDITIYFAVFIIILKVFGVDMTAFAVIGGAVGVGIGFGLQKIASNFISGIILLFEKSVEVGDLVESEDSKIFGTITHFSGRYTLIETLDGKEIMVPNEEFITSKVINWTYNNSRGRIDIKLKVPYDSNLKKVQELMIQSALESPRCLRYPTVECYANEFGEYAIEIVLFFWVSNVVEGRLGPKSEVMITILEKFAENGIKIAVPQRDIHIKSHEAITPLSD
ncbi:MAG: mechanosensitive ion channel [Proteobacteria bacterium]|nr:mechanosensitive ion channel [Pseudomonadota bacterium]